MADVIISNAATLYQIARTRHSTVFTTASIGYQLVTNASGHSYYQKTTDGGATWGTPVVINAADTTAADLWFDQWTPGDTTGTKIHIFYIDVPTADVMYCSLDTATDTVSAAVQIYAGASLAAAGSRYGIFSSGTKARSGYLYCAYEIDAGAEYGFKRSTDSGATWSAVLDATFVEADKDQAYLYPATDTGDNNDCWAIYHDTSANALTLKLWDNSAATTTESATIQTFADTATQYLGEGGYSAAMRLSDGHIILASVSERNTATADHQVWDIASIATITALTAITTNIANHYYPAVYIDPNSNDIYVAYNGARAGTDTLDTASKVYYVKSTDGGTTWSSGDTAYMVDAAAVVVQVWTPPTGPRFLASWRIGYYSKTNYTNSIVSTAAAAALAATPTAIATGTGALTTAITMLAAPSVLATVTGNLTTAIRLVSDAVAEATGTGNLTTGIQLAGNAVATASATGDLFGYITLAGDSVAVATATGDLTTAIRLNADSSAVATATGSLAAPVAFDSAAQAIASATGSLTTAIRLNSVAQAVATSTGGLTATNTQEISAAFYDSTGLGITGITTATLKIRKEVTGEFWDFDTQTLKTSLWSSISRAMLEVDATNARGLYKYSANFGLLPDGKYLALVDYTATLSQHAAVAFEMKGGLLIEDYNAAAISARLPAQLISGKMNSADSYAQTLLNLILGASSPTAAQIRAEMDANSTRLAAIYLATDTLEASMAALPSAAQIATAVVDRVIP